MRNLLAASILVPKCNASKTSTTRRASEENRWVIVTAWIRGRDRIVKGLYCNRIVIYKRIVEGGTSWRLVGCSRRNRRYIHFSSYKKTRRQCGTGWQITSLLRISKTSRRATRF